MIQNLVKSRSLLLLCCIFDAIFSLTILFMGSPAASAILRSFVPNRSTAELLGGVALAAGVCTIAAGIWNSKEANSWLLVLNGLACAALGTMVLLGARRPVAFRSIASLIVVMAVSIGIHELIASQKLRRHLADEWLLIAAGVASFGFAVVFLGFVLGWIRLAPSPSGQTFYWLSAYFAFSALCMLGLAVGRLRPPATLHRMSPGALPSA
jgi:uncharacterized membrane protein HdeD (DUF308 family)